MSIFSVCKGCNEVTKKASLKKVGILNFEYCNCCMVTIDAYLKERDALHDKLALEWKNGMGKIDKRCHKKGIKVIPNELKT